MGWESELFGVLDDLEQQAEAAYDLERAAELADRARAEYQHVTLASRVVASVGREVALEVRGVGATTGLLTRVGTGWCHLSGPAQDWVLHLPAVTAVVDASPRSVPEVAWPATSRLGIGSPLRRLADAGERCVVRTVDGAAHDGRLERVGADFVEVRTGSAGRVVLVALSALAAVQSRDP